MISFKGEPQIKDIISSFWLNKKEILFLGDLNIVHMKNLDMSPESNTKLPNLK
jgi:hypothetical protein